MKNHFPFLVVVISLIILIFAVMSSHVFQRESYPTPVPPLDTTTTACPAVTLPSCDEDPESLMCYEEIQDLIDMYPDCGFDALPLLVHPDPITGETCMVSGCSGEICQSADTPPMVSTCIYKPSYACYKAGRCELQNNGTCGWTQTPQLSQCINRASTQEENDVPR